MLRSAGPRNRPSTVRNAAIASTSPTGTAGSVEVVVKIDGAERLFAYEPPVDAIMTDAQRSNLRAEATAFCDAHMAGSSQADACARGLAERALLVEPLPHTRARQLPPMPIAVRQVLPHTHPRSLGKSKRVAPSRKRQPELANQAPAH